MVGKQVKDLVGALDRLQCLWRQLGTQRDPGPDDGE